MKYPHSAVHVPLYFILEHSGAHLSEADMEPGQAACACSQRRIVSMAGLWTAGPLTHRARQLDRYYAAAGQGAAIRKFPAHTKYLHT